MLVPGLEHEVLDCIAVVSWYPIVSWRDSKPSPRLPALGSPLPRAGEGLGVRARRTALAKRELVCVSIHLEMVTASSCDHLGKWGTRCPLFWFAKTIGNSRLTQSREDAKLAIQSVHPTTHFDSFRIL